MYDRIDLTSKPGRDQIVASTVLDFDDVFTGDVPDVFTGDVPDVFGVTGRRLMQETPKKSDPATEGSEPSAWPAGDFRNSPSAVVTPPDDEDDEPLDEPEDEEDFEFEEPLPEDEEEP